MKKFTKKPYSRQRAYQLAHKEKGLCECCNERAFGGTNRCLYHLKLRRQRERKNKGQVPWEVCHRGQPPREFRVWVRKPKEEKDDGDN